MRVTLSSNSGDLLGSAPGSGRSSCMLTGQRRYAPPRPTCRRSSLAGRSHRGWRLIGPARWYALTSWRPCLRSHAAAHTVPALVVVRVRVRVRERVRGRGRGRGRVVRGRVPPALDIVRSSCVLRRSKSCVQSPLKSTRPRSSVELPSFSSVTPAWSGVPTALRPSESCCPISSVCCAHSRRRPLVVISCWRPCSLRGGHGGRTEWWARRTEYAPPARAACAQTAREHRRQARRARARAHLSMLEAPAVV